jgi:hypothetical protein
VKVTTLNLLTLAGCAALVAIAFCIFPAAPRSADERSLPPLGAVPSGAAFVATLDVKALRRSELGAMLAGAGQEAPGLGRIADVCGFDPTTQIQFLAVAVPAATAQHQAELDFGVVAVGPFDAARLADCAAAVVARRSGAPARTTIGSFLTVRDRNRDSSGEIAVRDAGPVLISGGSYLRDMIDAVDAKIPSVLQDELHQTLRRSVGTDGTLVATWVLPPGWLERLVGSFAVAASPLSSIRAAALRIDVSPRVRAHAVLGCKTAESCRDIAAGLRQLRVAWQKEALSSMQRGALAERIKVASSGQELRVKLSLSQAEAELLAKELLARLGPTPSTAPTGSAPAAPTEVLRPADRSSAAEKPTAARPARTRSATAPTGSASADPD